MKQIKKPNGMRIFLFRFFVILMAVTMTCLGVTAVGKYFFDQEKDWEIQNYVNGFCSGISEKYAQLQLEGKKGQELTEEFKNYSQWLIDVSSINMPSHVNVGESSAYALYNVETKELYAITDKNVYLTCHDLKGLNGSYRYDGTDMEAFEKLNEKMEEIDRAEYEKDFPYSNAYYDYAVDGVYVTNHNTFIPDTIRLVKYDSYTKEEMETLLTFNMKPDDLSGYTYISFENAVNQDNRPYVILFGFGNGGAKKDLRNFLEGTFPWDETIDSILNDEQHNAMAWSDDNKKIISSRIYVNDEVFEVISCNTYDFWETKQYRYLKLYGFIAIFGFIVVVIWTIYSYKMKKGYYELDRNRKRTTDILAHDLKTPLMAISGYTENMENNTHPEKMDYYLQSIKSNVDYMNELIEKVLALGKVEEGGYQLSIEEVKLTDVLTPLEEKYESLLGKRDLQIAVSGDTTLHTDKVLLTQILDNLLCNSIKYALQGTVIEIVAEQGQFIISNQMETDISVTPEQLLQPFVKGNEVRTGATGAGLGLTIVSHIVELLKYKMNISVKENEFVVEIRGSDPFHTIFTK
ncbi:MAG: sensor histidine kinase [Lachnospiraceae bacterium]